MKKSVLTFEIFVLLVLFVPFQFAQATLQSNFVDPGMRQKNWGFLHTSPSLYFDPTCRESPSNDPIWRINTADITGTVCTPGGPVNATWSTTASGGQAVTISLDNSKNASNLQCTSVRNFVGIQPHYFPGFGYQQLLYYKNLTKLVVRARIRHNSQYACLSGSCSPQCFSDPSRFNPNGYGWTNLILAIPFYDQTYGRNLWLELVLHETPYWYNVDQGGVHFFHGATATEELWRIPITHPSNTQDKTVLNPGDEHFYEIDALQILNNLSWGNGFPIDWVNGVRFGDAYIGTEIFGDAKQSFTLSDIDVLYETKLPGDNNLPGGNHDGQLANCQTYGWTCDADRFAQSLHVHYYEGNQRINPNQPEQELANIVRESGVSGACGSQGSNHGFIATLPLPAGTHQITVKSVSINQNGEEGSEYALNNTPKSITCDGTTIPTPTPIPGDLNSDRKVNVTDLRSALSQSPLNIFTYNLVVGNYGRP